MNDVIVHHLLAIPKAARLFIAVSHVYQLEVSKRYWTTNISHICKYTSDYVTIPRQHHDEFILIAWSRYHLAGLYNTPVSTDILVKTSAPVTTIHIGSSGITTGGDGGFIGGTNTFGIGSTYTQNICIGMFDRTPLMALHSFKKSAVIGPPTIAFHTACVLCDVRSGNASIPLIHFRILYELLQESVLKPSDLCQVVRSLPYFTNIQSIQGVSMSSVETHNIIKLLECIIQDNFISNQTKRAFTINADLLDCPIRSIPGDHYDVLDRFFNLMI
jgi:hypothetical protein